MNKLPIPPKHIYDPGFEYRTAAQTDIRETFARIRSAMSMQKAKQQNKSVRRVK